ISGLNGVSTSFEKTVAAQDTHVRIEGQDIYRDSHVISDVIPGVSFQVLKEDPETPVTLTVTESITGASDKVQTLVDRYNEVVALLKKALQFDPNLKTQTNPTAGNSSLRNILTRVQSTFTS